MTKTVYGKAKDVALFNELYAEAKALDERGLFDKAKSYYNGCMSLVLSKRVSFKEPA